MLGDLHIHMILDGVDYRSAIDAHRRKPDDAIIRARLADYQARGVTFLRDGGDAKDVGYRARVLARDYGIDYRTPIFPIHKQGHYGAFIGRGYADFDGYRRLLDELRRGRADFVKLMISGLIDFSRRNTLTEPSLDAEEIFALIDEAHDRGYAVMVHANGDEAVTAALDAGVESIEHGAFLSEETLRRMAVTRTLWVPTLSTIGNLIGCGRYPDATLRELLQKQQEKVSFVAQNGGRIGLGSDAGAYRVLHGQAVLDELRYLSAALGDQTEAHLTAAENYAKIAFRRG